MRDRDWARSEFDAGWSRDVLRSFIDRLFRPLPVRNDGVDGSMSSSLHTHTPTHARARAHTHTKMSQTHTHKSARCCAPRGEIERSVWATALCRRVIERGARFGYSWVRYSSTCARQAQHQHGKGRVTQQRVEEEQRRVIGNSGLGTPHVAASAQSMPRVCL